MRKFVFHQKVGGIFGTIYFNLHPCKGKLCAKRSISLLIMFSNYSSTARDGGGGTKLLLIIEEKYCNDVDGDGETRATSKKGMQQQGD